MGMDHRWGRRQPTDLEVRFAAAAEASGTGRVLNISLTGAYLETQVPLNLLSVVYLESSGSAMGARQQRRIAASVVRQDARGVGLEWCENSTESTSVSARLAILAGTDIHEIRLTIRYKSSALGDSGRVSPNSS